uniref:Peptidase family m48 family protein n=2 Tax=Tetraselmis sp. GSL018 TaxID=582737 RepID=A0A061R7E7_9CHLO|mmetsp:Transcript_1985/g.4675  ORF Transcript_1985/g.4675 Transcript_1985/m.4675 type:complete len:361 (-) Transcript_1985:115-1197(-)
MSGRAQFLNFVRSSVNGTRMAPHGRLDQTKAFDAAPLRFRRGALVRAAQQVSHRNGESQHKAAAAEGVSRLADERVMAYEGLSGEDFRHPLDQQNTSFLQMLPGLESLAKGFMGPVAEQVLLLENIGTSIRVSEDQMPSVHALLMEACQVLGMEAPELYIRQNSQPNAYTLAISGRKPFIVMHTSLLELLTPAELQVVIAHELGHLKCDHGLWLTVANMLASGAVSILPVISSTLEEGLLRWLRAAELTCDRAALLVAQDAKTVVSALMKLAGGSPSFAHELNVDAFLKQARSYDEATSSPLGWYLRNAQNRALSHPLPVMRAREIDRWAQSAQYRALLSKNRKFRRNGSSPSRQAVNMS